MVVAGAEEEEEELTAEQLAWLRQSTSVMFECGEIKVNVLKRRGAAAGQQPDEPLGTVEVSRLRVAFSQAHGRLEAGLLLGSIECFDDKGNHLVSSHSSSAAEGRTKDLVRIQFDQTDGTAGLDNSGAVAALVEQANVKIVMSNIDFEARPAFVKPCLEFVASLKPAATDTTTEDVTADLATLTSTLRAVTTIDITGPEICLTGAEICDLSVLEEPEPEPETAAGGATAAAKLQAKVDLTGIKVQFIHTDDVALLYELQLKHMSAEYTDDGAGITVAEAKLESLVFAEALAEQGLVNIVWSGAQGNDGQALLKRSESTISVVYTVGDEVRHPGESSHTEVVAENLNMKVCMPVIESLAKYMGEDLLAALATKTEESAKEYAVAIEGKKDIVKITMVDPRINACLERGSTAANVSIAASKLTMRHDPFLSTTAVGLFDGNIDAKVFDSTSGAPWQLVQLTVNPGDGGGGGGAQQDAIELQQTGASTKVNVLLSITCRVWAAGQPDAPLGTVEVSRLRVACSQDPGKLTAELSLGSIECFNDKRHKLVSSHSASAAEGQAKDLVEIQFKQTDEVIVVEVTISDIDFEARPAFVKPCMDFAASLEVPTAEFLASLEKVTAVPAADTVAVVPKGSKWAVAKQVLDDKKMTSQKLWSYVDLDALKAVASAAAIGAGLPGIASNQSVLEEPEPETVPGTAVAAVVPAVAAAAAKLQAKVDLTGIKVQFIHTDDVALLYELQLKHMSAEYTDDSAGITVAKADLESVLFVDRIHGNIVWSGMHKNDPRQFMIGGAEEAEVDSTISVEYTVGDEVKYPGESSHTEVKAKNLNLMVCMPVIESLVSRSPHDHLD